MRTPRLFMLISIVVPCAATGAACAADDCVAKPNAPAGPGQHGYYRADGNVRRQCWSLAPQGPSVEKSATETAKQIAPEKLKIPTASSGAPRATTGSTGKPAAAVPLGFAPATAPGWPDNTGGLEKPLSLEPAPHPPLASTPGAATAIAEAQDLPAHRGPSGGAAATHVMPGNHTFALIMLATVLLAIAGPVMHAARSRRQRKGGDRNERGAPRPSIVSTSDSHAPITGDPTSQTPVRYSPQRPGSLDQTKDVAQTLQRLIDEMETGR